MKYKQRQRIEEGGCNFRNLLFTVKRNFFFFFCRVHQQKRITVTAYPTINLTDIGNLSIQSGLLWQKSESIWKDCSKISSRSQEDTGMVLIKLSAVLLVVEL